MDSYDEQLEHWQAVWSRLEIARQDEKFGADRDLEVRDWIAIVGRGVGRGRQ